MKRIAVVCARASIKIADVALNFVVLVALLVLMTVGVYGLWDNKEIESEGTAVTWQAYKPEAQGEDLGFDELRKINPEVQAWLTLYGTNIDYPVVYSDNEWKYLNRNPKGEHALAGSLFFDSQTLPNLSSFPTVIYGHHMAHNAMFGQLDDYKNPTFFEEHRYGNYYYDGRDWGLEIIGFFNTSAYNTSVYRPINTSGSGREEYVQRIMSMADPQRGGVVVGRSDGLLLMSTCASDETNSRTVVVARITEETYPDTFVEEKNTGSGLSDDRGWFGIPQLAWVLFFIALAAFIGIFIVQKVRDEKKKQLSSRESVNPAPSLRGTSEASGEAISSEPISTSPPSPFNSPAMTDVEQVLSKEEV